MLSVSAFSFVTAILQVFSSVIPAYAADTRLPLEKKLCFRSGEYVVFAQSRLGGSTNLNERGGKLDSWNIENAHEHIFFCKDGKIVDNKGFTPASNTLSNVIYGSGRLFSEKIEDVKIQNYTLIDKQRYDSKIIRSILNEIPKNKTYCLIGRNCQNFTEDVRQEYQKRTQSPTNSFKTTIDLTKGSLYSTNALIPSLVTDEEGRGRTVILYTSEKYKNKGIIIHGMNPVPISNITTVFFRFVKPNNAKISTTIDGFQLNLVVQSNVKLTWYDNKSRIIGQKTINNSGFVNIRNSGIARVQVGTLTEQDDEKFRINNFSFTLFKK